MLVKLQTTDYLIYAEPNKTERITHLALKNRIPAQMATWVIISAVKPNLTKPKTTYCVV